MNLTKNIIKAEGATCTTKTKNNILPVKGHIMIGKVKNMKNMVFYCSDAYAHWENHENSRENHYGLSFNQKPTHIYGKVLNNEIMIGGGRKLIDDTNDFDIEKLEMDSILKKAQSIFGNLDDFKPEQVYTGIMPFSETRKIMVEEENRVFTVNGLGANGIMHGPGLAKFVAEWVHKNFTFYIKPLFCVFRQNILIFLCSFTGTKPKELDNL